MGRFGEIIYVKIQSSTLVFSKCWLVCYCYSFLVAQMVGKKKKTLPATQETQVRSLGREDPLEEVMATQSSIRVWKIPWTLEPGGL